MIIVAWHGMSEGLKERLIEVEGVCAGPDGKFKYNGTLDDFVKNWTGPVIINKVDGYIAVTQYSNFHPR